MAMLDDAATELRRSVTALQRELDLRTAARRRLGAAGRDERDPTGDLALAD